MPLEPVSKGDPHVAAHNDERNAINDLIERVVALEAGEVMPEGLAARLLPTDGAQDMVLKRDTTTPDAIAVWEEPPALTKYRGAWGPDEEVYFEDFSSGTVGDFTLYQPGAIVPTFSIEGMAVNAGTNKPAFTNVLKYAVQPGNSGTRAGVTLNLPSLSELAGLTATRVKFYEAVNAVSISSKSPEFLEAEVIRQALGAPTTNGGTSVWESWEISLGSTTPIHWQMRSTGSSAGGTNSYLAGVSVYATAEPYLRGDVVDHLGVFYRSLVNNNSSTPGASSSWEQITT